MLPVLVGVTLGLLIQGTPADSLPRPEAQNNLRRPIVFECAAGAFHTCASQSLSSRLSPDRLGFTVVISQPGVELTLPYGLWGRRFVGGGAGGRGAGGGRAAPRGRGGRRRGH